MILLKGESYTVSWYNFEYRRDLFNLPKCVSAAP